jgi:ADP-ribose pyrophosphatase YjhB (NUDIX family)
LLSAFQREIKEETGLTIERARVFTATDAIFLPAFHYGIVQFVSVFRPMPTATFSSSSSSSSSSALASIYNTESSTSPSVIELRAGDDAAKCEWVDVSLLLSSPPSPLYQPQSNGPAMLLVLKQAVALVQKELEIEFEEERRRSSANDDETAY